MKIMTTSLYSYSLLSLSLKGSRSIGRMKNGVGKK